MGDLWLPTLITANPPEGFAVAVTLSWRGVKTTQPDTDVLKQQRPADANDANGLTAASQVIAINCQATAAANQYWRHLESATSYSISKSFLTRREAADIAQARQGEATTSGVI